MFIIITRFSLFVPKSSSWLVSKSKDLENYKKIIFDEERLNFRLNFIKKITLPIISEASKKHNIAHIIKYSNLLPGKYKSELERLSQKYPFLVLCEHDENGEYPIPDMQIGINKLNLASHNKDLFVGVLVLDDDDALAIDYFDRAALYLNKSFLGMALSFGLGVNGIFNEENQLIKITESYYPKVNIGLMRVGIFRLDLHNIIMGSMGSHGRADRFVPVILDSRKISYFWSRHSYQDTTQELYYKNVIAQALKQKEITADILDESFGAEFTKNIRNI